KAKSCVKLIDTSVGRYARMVLGHARAVAQCGIAFVAGLRVDAGKVDHTLCSAGAGLQRPEFDLAGASLKAAAAGHELTVNRKLDVFDPLLDAVQRHFLFTGCRVPQRDVPELSLKAAARYERLAVGRKCQGQRSAARRLTRQALLPG